MNRYKLKRLIAISCVTLLLIGIPACQVARLIHQQGLDRGLIDAIRRNDLGGVQSLLRRGADSNATVPTDRPRAFRRILISLVNRHALTPGKPSIPILAATVSTYEETRTAVIPCPEIVEALLNAGANPNIRDELGMTPLSRAASSGNLEEVQSLLGHGSDVDSKSNYGGTPLYYAATCPVAALLLDHGADVNAQDTAGDTPLMSLTSRGGDTVRLLIQHGAIVNIRNKRGYSALVMATSAGDVETVGVPLNAGADHNLPAQDVLGLAAYRQVLINTCFGPSSRPNPKRELLLSKLR